MTCIKFVLLVNKQGQTRCVRLCRCLTYQSLPKLSFPSALQHFLTGTLGAQPCRLAKYTDASRSIEERRALEGEVVRKCLARSEKQVNVSAKAVSTDGAGLSAVAAVIYSFQHCGGLKVRCDCCSAPSWSSAVTRSCTGGMHPSSSSSAWTLRRCAFTPLHQCP